MSARHRATPRNPHVVAVGLATVLAAVGLGLAPVAQASEPADGAGPIPFADPPPVDLHLARKILEPSFAAAPADHRDDDFAPQAWQGGSGHLLALILLHTYRSTLARSDMDLCAFRPSCSRFAQLAIDEFGTIRGILLGTDRLLRDGPSALDYGYRPAGDGRHLLDPITDYQDSPCTTCP